MQLSRTAGKASCRRRRRRCRIPPPATPVAGPHTAPCRMLLIVWRACMPRPCTALAAFPCRKSCCNSCRSCVLPRAPPPTTPHGTRKRTRRTAHASQRRGGTQDKPPAVVRPEPYPQGLLLHCGHISVGGEGQGSEDTGQADVDAAGCVLCCMACASVPPGPLPWCMQHATVVHAIVHLKKSSHRITGTGTLHARSSASGYP